MRILLDTNILIPLESHTNELDKNLADIIKRCSEQNINLRIHPCQFNDVEQDKNKNRRKVFESHLEKYAQIEKPPRWENDELNKLGITQNKRNDVVDNALLCAVYRNCVDFLITEDRGIHKKAKKIEIQERIFYRDSFLAYLNKKDSKNEKIPLGISSCFLNQLKIEDDFFDSLRNTYKDFDNWFKLKALEQRKAWCVKVEDNLKALVIWKEEQNTQFKDQIFLDGKILKLCTFKVDSSYRGRKIGERLLYTAFCFAKDKRYDRIYITITGDEQPTLVSMCEEYGFYYFAKDKKTNDNVYVKDMKPPSEDDEILSNLDYTIKYYPSYRKDNCKKYIVPIQPEFHKILFPDKQDQTLLDNIAESYKPCQNAIKKAYVCNASITKIKAGDLLYFYRSQDEQSVRVEGVVEKAFHSDNINEINSNIAKRTVYNKNQIKEIAKKNTLVILFRLLRYLPKDLSLSSLIEKGYIKSPPQTIMEIKGEIDV